MYEGMASRFRRARRHPEPIKNGLPDMPTNGVFQYGIYERRVCSTVRQARHQGHRLMIGQAVDKDRRWREGWGVAEAAAHGRTWSGNTT
jgi:hypothetical protein